MDVEVVVDNLTGGPSDSFSNSFPVSLHRHPHVLTLLFTESPHVLRQIVIDPKDHQAKRTTLQQVLHDGILPGLYRQPKRARDSGSVVCKAHCWPKPTPYCRRVCDSCSATLWRATPNAESSREVHSYFLSRSIKKAVALKYFGVGPPL